MRTLHIQLFIVSSSSEILRRTFDLLENSVAAFGTDLQGRSSDLINAPSFRSERAQINPRVSEHKTGASKI